MTTPAIHPTSGIAHCFYDIVGPLSTLFAKITSLLPRKLSPEKAETERNFRESEAAQTENAVSSWRKLVTPGEWLGSDVIHLAATLKPTGGHHVLSQRDDWTSLTPTTLETLEKDHTLELKEGGSILVPLEVRAGLFDSNHIVWVGCKDNMLFYYDPKGRGPSHVKVTEAITTIGHRYGIDERNRIVNPVRHQTDSHNCGAWGLQLMKAIQTGSFAAFLQTPNVNIEETRIDYAAEIVDHYASTRQPL